jgi:hypothetical protein
VRDREREGGEGEIDRETDINSTFWHLGDTCDVAISTPRDLETKPGKEKSCSKIFLVFPKFSIGTIRTVLFIHLWP